MPANRFCKRDAAADIFSAVRRIRRSCHKANLPPHRHRENRMLDSVRVRLTLWYSLVLAFVLVLLAVFTYFLYWRSISQRTDTGLSELADAFVTTFHAELKDETGPDAVKNAAHVAMLEHRFRDTVIAVLGPANNIVESSLELPRVSSSSREPITADLFSSKDFQSLVRETSSDPSGFRNVPGGRAGFRAFARQVRAAGQNFTLVVLQSLHPQQEMMEAIRDTFLWAIPIALLLAGIGGYFSPERASLRLQPWPRRPATWARKIFTT